MASDDPRVRELTEVASSRQGALAALARQCLGGSADRALLEEVLSDAYFRAFRRLQREPSLRVAHMEAWFRKFVVFACLKQRSRRRWLQATDEQLLELEVEDEFLDRVAWGENSALQRALSQLSTEDRELLEWFAAGHNAREVGERLNATPEAVRQRKSRLIKSLARQVQGIGR